MPDHDTDLERQLRAWADDLSDQVTAKGSVVEITSAARRRGRARYLAVAVAVLAIVAVAAVLATRRDYSVRVTTHPDTARTLTVEYERSEYRQTAHFQCTPTVNGHFDRWTVETWGDRTGRRWRTRTTYPDGSTRDTIFTGSPWYPDARYLRGKVLGAQRGCTDGRVGIQLFDSDDVGSMNPMADEPGDGSLITGYAENGVVVPGDHRDSTGRPATLYRATTGGTSSSEGLLPVRIDQTSDWYVDQHGVLIEAVSTSDIAGLSHTESVQTLVARGTREVPADWFSTAGYERRPGRPQPASCADCHPPGPATTTTVKADRAPDAYCDAVEALRQSGTIAADGSFTPDAVPYLEAIAKASPPDIAPAQQALLDAARAGTPPPGTSAADTTQYWAAHCTG
ncbi:MAG: hypothetical protein JO291_02590 [Acidimicrobiia bacterium]|nr:hypothetical protein [Acidimicrobiia bacterium]